MSFEKPFDYDPITGRTRTFHALPDGRYVIESKYPEVPAIIEENKPHFNDAPSRFGKGTFHRVASIPLYIFQQLREQGILQDQKAMAKWLNDSDNRVWRTRPGKV